MVKKKIEVTKHCYIKMCSIDCNNFYRYIRSNKDCAAYQFFNISKCIVIVNFNDAVGNTISADVTLIGE